jgi:hypothetical protein
LRFADRGEHRSGAIEQLFASPSQDHATGHALEEADAQRLFEAGELMAQRRLRNVEAHGGAGHGALDRDCFDQPEMTKFQLHASYYYHAWWIC